MQLICDIGTTITSSELNRLNGQTKSDTKFDREKNLLYHFIKHYDNIGIQQYLFFGSDKLCEVLKSMYADSRFVFIPINIEKLQHYQNAAVQDEIAKKAEGSGHLYNICSSTGLWMIGNDIKKEYVNANDWAFILELDEFVDISKEEIEQITNSDSNYAEGQLVDMFADNGHIPPLTNEKSIYQQFPIKTQLTKFIKRAFRKVFMTKGKLEHCFGQHGLYSRNKESAIRFPKNFDVLHFKWFAQNLIYIQNGYNPEAQHISDNKICRDIFNKITL